MFATFGEFWIVTLALLDDLALGTLQRYKYSSCGSVDSALQLSRYTRGPGFESSPWQLFEQIFTFCGKDKNKEKGAQRDAIKYAFALLMREGVVEKQSLETVNLWQYKITQISISLGD